MINPIAEQRSVLLLDNAGVGKSNGQVPVRFAGWAENVIVLLRALNISKIDLLGFSMGGYAAQMVALNGGDLVRKLVLAGTGPSLSPNRVVADAGPFIKLLKASTTEENELAIRDSFYYPTAAGRKAARASWERIQERKDDRAGLLGEEGTKNQAASGLHWSKPNPENSYDRLHELRMPVLIANGDKDALIHTANSWDLYQNISNARLAIYPGAGHGFLNQYATEIAARINEFLDQEMEKVEVAVFKSKI